MADALPAILQTKLSLPVSRTALISRPHLAAQFNAALDVPLTLICAPAGFGKTTLIGEWVVSDLAADVPLAWLSLDDDDNDSTHFLTYLIAAIENAGVVTGSDDLIALLHSSQAPPPKTILTALISRVEMFPRRFVLVLDDYHRVTAQPLHDALNFLIDHFPANMRLVITSREDPPLPLSRLRGRGQLSEIRAEDLRFNIDEARQFLEQMLGLELKSDQVSELALRTEGWIAGLQLVALAMKGRKDIPGFITAFTGSHRYILDYLTEEVLNQQSTALQNFLLHTSILKRLSGSLCNAVTGRTDGQSALEQIERGNLFLISLDDDRSWYRYHHLFGDMLRQRLRQSEPQLVSELYRRASRWFEQNGSLNEAIDYALLDGDGEQAARLVEQYGDATWQRGEMTTFLRWVRALPEDILRKHPRLGLSYAFVRILTDNFVEAEQSIAQVEEVLLEDGQQSVPRHQDLLGFAAIIRATVAFQLEYEPDTIIALAHQALDQLPDGISIWRSWLVIVIGCVLYYQKGDMRAGARWLEEAIKAGETSNEVNTLMPALTHLSRLRLIQGNIRQAEAAARRLFQCAVEPVYKGEARLLLSKVYYERNDLPEALEAVNEGWEQVKDHPIKRLALDGYVTRARLKHLQGDTGEARSLMQQAVSIVHDENLKQIFLPADAWQAWLWLKQGDIESVRQWAKAVEPTVSEILNPGLEFEHIMLARFWIVEGRLQEARQLLNRLLKAAQAGERMAWVITISILQAVVAQMRGESEFALAALESALSIAEPEGYLRSFADENLLDEGLLHSLRARGVAPHYITRLLTVFEQERSHLPAAPAPVPVAQSWIGERIEPLSERELEVLRLLIEGASNRDIAEQLYVSIGTVKKHLNNIFAKTGAHSRTQVVAVAKKHNLL